MTRRLARVLICTAVTIGFAVSFARPAAAAAASVPPTARKLVDRGDKLEEKGDHKGAIAAYDEAIADDPAYAYAYASRCESEWALDQNTVAARDCEHAIALDPSSAYAYRQYALALGDMGDNTRALDAATKSIQLDPGRSFNYAVRCTIDANLKLYDAAIADCNRAVAMDPKAIRGHLQRGRAELESGDYAAAEGDSTWVVENHPDEESAWYNRALARLHGTNLDGALSDIGRYINVEPTDGDGYYVKARIELARNDKPAAKDAANEAWRRYQAAGDKANVKKAKEFIASNDLETASPFGDVFAGILGVFVIIIALVLILALNALIIWALWRVLERAGLQGPLALLALIPFGFFVCLCILAFSAWSVRPRDPTALSG
jgi:tetratricopeptide (TPR) repeat protein